MCVGADVRQYWVFACMRASYTRAAALRRCQFFSVLVSWQDFCKCGKMEVAYMSACLVRLS
jgi:hypothetical protein